MKTLINAVKSALQGAAALSYVTDTNIVIIPDEDLLPVDIGFPAIGLKDGAVGWERGSTDNFDNRYNVDVIIYVLLSAGETPIIGQVSPKIYGTLDIRDNILSVLDDNTLSISGIIENIVIAEKMSELMGNDDLLLLKKKMTYQYLYLHN